MLPRLGWMHLAVDSMSVADKSKLRHREGMSDAAYKFFGTVPLPIGEHVNEFVGLGHRTEELSLHTEELVTEREEGRPVHDPTAIAIATGRSTTVAVGSAIDGTPDGNIGTCRASSGRRRSSQANRRGSERRGCASSTARIASGTDITRTVTPAGSCTGSAAGSRSTMMRVAPNRRCSRAISKVTLAGLRPCLRRASTRYRRKTTAVPWLSTAIATYGERYATASIGSASRAAERGKSRVVVIVCPQGQFEQSVQTWHCDLVTSLQ
jgi:hypothetical protein